MGNYVLVHESGVPKYTVDPKKVLPNMSLSWRMLEEMIYYIYLMGIGIWRSETD